MENEQIEKHCAILVNINYLAASLLKENTIPIEKVRYTIGMIANTHCIDKLSAAQILKRALQNYFELALNDVSAELVKKVKKEVDTLLNNSKN